MRTLKEFTSWLEEEQGTNTFSMEHLKSLTNKGEPKDVELARIRFYLGETLGKPVGLGAFREVYKISEDLILKLVLESGDTIQNRQEKKNSDCLGPQFAIKVLDHDENFLWIVEEKVNTLKKQEFVAKFAEAVGVKLSNQIEDIAWIIQAIVSNTVSNKKQQSRHADIAKQFKRSPWFISLIDGLKGCNTDSEDFHHANWGVRSNGDLVLIDLGF